MPNKPLWYWDDSVSQYRDPVTGRFVGISQMQDLRNEYIERQKEISASLAQSYRTGEISIYQLENSIKDLIKNTYIDLYAMGAGGRNNLSQRDWGRIGAMLKEQYGQNGYLRGFMEQIAAGNLSEAQIAARLNMYINSANEALWKALTRDLGFDLPAYPGDGSTECLTNCRCEWDIREVLEGYDCYWIVDHEAENCDDCLGRGSDWAPWKWPIARQNE
jgi:hypothetical protein